MRTSTLILSALIALSSTVAIAKDGVTNPAVKARTQAMDIISQNMKTIGGMAQGKIEFNAAAAQAAVDAIAQQAAQIPALFEAPETDPKSEAKPAIWSNWNDFTTKANALESAAEGTDASSVNGLGQALGAMGGSCRSCHQAYRI